MFRVPPPEGRTDDQGRRAISLVPDLHVCIVDAAQVVADVPDAITLLEPARPLRRVSGLVAAWATHRRSPAPAEKRAD